MELVDAYATKLAQTSDSVLARRKAVGLFQDKVKASFERVTGEKFPDSTECAAVNDDEQAAFRALHDILPGALVRDTGDVFYVTDYRTATTRLSFNELSRPIPQFDGAYDAAYLSIVTPGGRPPVNLQEADKAFIESRTSYKQADMLAQLAAFTRSRTPGLIAGIRVSATAMDAAKNPHLKA